MPLESTTCNNIQNNVHTPTLPSAPLLPIGLATPLSPESAVVQRMNMPGKGRLGSPVKTTTRRPSQTRNTFPTPLSMSPSLPRSSNSQTSLTGAHRLPPAFDHTSHPHSRYSSSQTQFSPYRPGEYGRSERGIASERTKITKVERKLFDDEKSRSRETVEGEELNVPKVPKEGSSPLAPAFEAKMVLRNGASVDLISWLRTNFHHIPEHQHNSMTPQMSLIGVRALLLERFPRVPDLTELSKAVLAAFPHSRWEVSKGAYGEAESPTVRGLVWHGKDVADEDDEEEEERERQERERERREHHRRPQIVTRARAASGKVKEDGSRSPTQSTLVSPISSSKRGVPDTPARSVLDEFAEIATLADKTPASKAKSLPGELAAPSPAYALANICNSFDHDENDVPLSVRKRKARDSPEPLRRRASTPDKLHGLLAAAEAVEGSPITSVLGHKRRRTIGGPATVRDLLNPGYQRRKATSRGTASPAMSRSFLPDVYESMDVDGELTADLLVPLNDTASAISLTDLETVSLAAQSRPSGRGHNSASTSQASITSMTSLGLVTGPSAAASSNANNASNGRAGASRRPNELPTQGDHPGVDCKPPYPYHELIRHAIEEAPDRRLQLNQIYASIAERFPFFKTLDEKKTAGWQNSIRHNLSLKKMFVRVNKVDGVPDDNNGKGGWWTVQVGVPDEGRPGRKTKSKKRNSGEAVESLVGDDASEQGESVIEATGGGDVSPEKVEEVAVNGWSGQAYEPKVDGAGWEKMGGLGLGMAIQPVLQQ